MTLTLLHRFNSASIQSK